MTYAQHFSTRKTPQTEQADPRQVKNSAGGYSFEITPWQRLDRFLILGCEGGTYYATERKLTIENAKCVQTCLADDAARTVEAIATISEQGRAPKNDPAIFALAIAAGVKGPNSAIALAALPRVCRTATHLFQFCEAVKNFRGWGTGLKRAVAAWYNQHDERSLCYQITKYQQRNGWSHRDLLRLSHAELKFPVVGRYMATGAEGLGDRQVTRKQQKLPVTYASVGELPAYLAAFEELKHADAKRTIELIRAHGFTHEMVDSQHKNNVDVWAALLEKMPMTAMIRNLGKMTSVGLIAPLSEAAKTVSSRLGDAEYIRKSRLHPIAILLASRVYAQGHGDKGSLTWATNPRVLDALNEAFYLAFGNVQPTGKRTLIAIDVSGSMTCGSIAGAPGITPNVASAAMALVTMRTEPEWHCVGFSDRMFDLGLTDKMRLDDVVHKASRLNGGGTDCALPMLWAAGSSVKVDTFVELTDGETWQGHIHPHQALRAYREKSGVQAKWGVIAMTATSFSLCDADDPGQMAFVGFDASTPQVLAEFAKM